jgi:para-nitrobenzyl esterase
MVYVHGGSNNSGWAYEPNYHGHALAERGVVLVSIAYRMGVFGFFSHPDLDAANFGLWDQIAALEWIQKYIGAFGGDPDRVTIFGESAGAQDILALMASRKADGLYHGAIMQSNAGFGLGPRASPSLEDEQNRGAETANILGFVGGDTLSALRSVPALELLEKYEARFPRYYHSPATDGQLLAKPIWEVINDNELSSVPFIIGSNADERYDPANSGATREDIQKVIESSRFLNTPEALAAIVDDPDPANAIDRIRTANGMLCPSQYLAAHQAALQDNAWIYYFSRVRDGDAGAEVRAYHGAELPYAFGTHDPWMTTTDVDWQLAEQMNVESLPEWPTFTQPNGRTMEFANEAASVAAQEPILCRLFREAVN